LPDYLTIREVAEELRVSKMTIYRLVHSGELPCIRVGRSFRIERHELNAYLNHDQED
jgi:excisionase family DNA binding protein